MPRSRKRRGGNFPSAKVPTHPENNQKLGSIPPKRKKAYAANSSQILGALYPDSAPSTNEDVPDDEYQELYDYFCEPRVHKNVKMPHAGMRIRHQTRPPVLHENTKPMKELRRRIEILLSQGKINEVYCYLKLLREFMEKNNCILWEHLKNSTPSIKPRAPRRTQRQQQDDDDDDDDDDEVEVEQLPIEIMDDDDSDNNNDNNPEVVEIMEDELEVEDRVQDFIQDRLLNGNPQPEAVVSANADDATPDTVPSDAMATAAHNVEVDDTPTEAAAPQPVPAPVDVEDVTPDFVPYVATTNNDLEINDAPSEAVAPPEIDIDKDENTEEQAASGEHGSMMDERMGDGAFDDDAPSFNAAAIDDGADAEKEPADDHEKLTQNADTNNPSAESIDGETPVLTIDGGMGSCAQVEMPLPPTPAVDGDGDEGSLVAGEHNKLTAENPMDTETNNNPSEAEIVALAALAPTQAAGVDDAADEEEAMARDLNKLAQEDLNPDAAIDNTPPEPTPVALAPTVPPPETASVGDGANEGEATARKNGPVNGTPVETLAAAPKPRQPAGIFEKANDQSTKPGRKDLCLPLATTINGAFLAPNNSVCGLYHPPPAVSGMAAPFLTAQQFHEKFLEVQRKHTNKYFNANKKKYGSKRKRTDKKRAKAKGPDHLEPVKTEKLRVDRMRGKTLVGQEKNSAASRQSAYESLYGRINCVHEFTNEKLDEDVREAIKEAAKEANGIFGQFDYDDQGEESFVTENNVNVDWLLPYQDPESKVGDTTYLHQKRWRYQIIRNESYEEINSPVLVRVLEDGQHSTAADACGRFGKEKNAHWEKIRDCVLQKMREMSRLRLAGARGEELAMGSVVGTHTIAADVGRFQFFSPHKDKFKNVPVVFVQLQGWSIIALVLAGEDCDKKKKPCFETNTAAYATYNNFKVGQTEEVLREFDNWEMEILKRAKMGEKVRLIELRQGDMLVLNAGDIVHGTVIPPQELDRILAMLHQLEDY